MTIRIKKVNKDLFADVFSGGKRVATKFFNICFKKDKDQKIFCCSVVISKKILAKATKRNLLRRRVRHIVVDFLLRNNYDFFKKITIVFFTKTEARNAQFNDLKSDIHFILSKIIQ